METDFEMPKRGQTDGLVKFADKLQDISRTIGFKISARGWAYQLEGFGLITKAEFDQVENIINKCRASGYLPIDFTAEEEARKFSGVEKPEEVSPIDFMKEYLQATLRCEDWYTPDWWDGETHYIQMVVEKIDLKTLFSPICEQFHIPIATSKGWSSMLQRAEYARRFLKAEERALECVLLYCGDYDPDGLRISQFLRENLEDLADIVWEDGTLGYCPDGLTIDRFGLNFDFIEQNNLTWIDNLITSSKKDLASPSHKNHYLPYVQEYLAKVGVRKCEANALVVRPVEAQALVLGTIESYLGADALERFQNKRQAVRDTLADFREQAGLQEVIKEALQRIEEANHGS